MPELPDVELYRRRLERHGLHRRIEAVEVGDTRLLANITGKALSAALAGHAFEETRRHGKHLLVRLDDGHWLTLHFGMTGDLQPFAPSLEGAPDYNQLRLDFDRGALAYVSRRKLGRIGLVEDAEAFLRAEALGPDALEVSEDTFLERLGGRRGGVKAALTDQSLFAGIGNLYADEILFQARLHPKTKLSALNRSERRALYHAMRKVLTAAVEAEAGSERLLDRLPDDFLLPHRDAGQSCPRCGGPLKSLQVGGRRSTFCPRCQPPSNADA